MQQHSDSTHIAPNKPILLQAASSNRNIRMACQSPSSPDFNILDLGFFNSTPNLEIIARSIAELIEAVENNFKVYLQKRFQMSF